MDPILTAEGICFSYGRKPVLHDVEFHVFEKDFLGIIGPNGSGKTTLLKILSGVVTPEKGRVLFRGRPLESYSRRMLARKMGMVSQEYSLTYPMTAREVVLMGRFAHMGRLAFESAADLEAVERAMRLTDTLHLADRIFQELSGGERQRVVIARALAQEPEVILFDEPTAFLDIRHQVDFFDFIWELNHTTGLTVVTVSHDINLAAQYCTELLLLSKGRLYRKGAAEEVVTEEAIAEVYGKRVLLDRNPLVGTPRITLVSQLPAFTNAGKKEEAK